MLRNKPRLESGRLDLSDDTFRELARAYPAFAPLSELRSALFDMRLSGEWGADAKSRALRALEHAGLERREKRSPRVTLVVGNTATKDAWEEFNRRGAAQARSDSV
jgi:hypothetical protein